MNGQRKPRQPRTIALNTMEIALHHAAKPASEDRAQVLAVVRKAHKALREGVATKQQWSVLAGSLEVASAIERQGIVRGLFEHFATADTALQSIHERAMSSGTWRPTTLYFHELDAVTVFVNLHVHQFNQLGRAELINAMNAAAAHTAATGNTTTIVRNTERMAA